MKFVVKVMPRPEALDPQGRAVEGMLKKLGHSVEQCRVGKMIELNLENVKSETEGKELVRKMAGDLLYNPLIETFEVEVKA